MTDHITFHELIQKHDHHREKKIKHEFVDLFIRGDNEEIEADLSGISIRDSIFSGVNFAKVKLTNATLSNVQFADTQHLTITICKGPKGPKDQNPPAPNSGVATSVVIVQEQEERPSQLQLLGWETTRTISVASAVPDLSTVLQDIRSLERKTIIRLIQKSLIREAVDRATNTSRPEQARFRSDLLDGYDHQCAVSGSARDDILEAAHIIPYFLLEKVGAGEFGNSRWNGLALRPGLHKLFDENKLRITDKGIISVDSQVPGFYVNWEQVVQPPRADNPPVVHEQVWRDFLRWRWEEYGKYVKYVGN